MCATHKYCPMSFYVSHFPSSERDFFRWLNHQTSQIKWISSDQSQCSIDWCVFLCCEIQNNVIKLLISWSIWIHWRAPITGNWHRVVSFMGIWQSVLSLFEPFYDSTEMNKGNAEIISHQSVFTRLISYPIWVAPNGNDNGTIWNLTFTALCSRATKYPAPAYIWCMLW